MSSVYKKSRDRKRPGASWYITYVDNHGRRRTVKGCPDKAATEAMARKLESEAELRRRGVIDVRADHLATHEARSLADHLVDFHAFLLGKGTTVKHAELTRNRVARLIDLARARRVSDLAPSRVQASLKTVRETGVSLRSVHHYTRAVKAFSRWLWRDGRAREDALAHLTSSNPDADRRHERRALTPAEVAGLIEAAVHGPDVEGLNGPGRAVLYRLALGTGFRAGELGSLTLESFDLDGDPPTVTVRAGYSKRRRDDAQPIRPDLADALRSWLASKVPRESIFGELSKYTSRMIQRDLKAAGVPYQDASGRFADFHALRHTYISALAMSAAPVKVIQSLARHSTPTLTLGTYAHVGVLDQTAALGALPGLTPAARTEVQIPAAASSDPMTCVDMSDPESAAHGQRAADGVRQDEAGSGGSSGSKGVAGEAKLVLHNPSETRGLDSPSRNLSASDSGGGGIRTHGYAERINGFQDRPDQPLWHPSRDVRARERRAPGTNLLTGRPRR
jgi:integrase/recombinase XerD